MANKIFIIIFLLFYQVNICFALDWQRIHEEADKTDSLKVSLEKETPRQSLPELYLYGLVYLNMHKDEKAKIIFDEMLSLKPDLTEAKWGIAEVMRRYHKLAESEKALGEIIKSEPQFSPAYISLAYIKYTRLDLDGCVALAFKVIRQGRKNVDVSNYARAYLLIGGAKGLIAHYGGYLSKIINGIFVLSTLRRAQKLRPNAAEVLLGLGSFYLLAPPIVGGDRNKAEDYLKRALLADPFLADTYVRLAQLYKIQGDNVKYELYLNEALKIDPQSELALDIKNKQCKFVCP